MTRLTILDAPIPSTFLRYLAEGFQDTRHLVGGTPYATLADLPASIPIRHHLQLFRNLEQYSGHPDFQIRLLQLGFPYYGRGLGIAIRYAPTLRSAIMLQMDHGRLRPGYNNIRLDCSSTRATVTILMDPDTEGEASGIVEALVMLVRMLLILHAFSLDERVRVQFRHRAPGYSANLVRAFACAVEFEGESDEISFPVDWLDRPNLLHDPDVWAVAVARCEEETRNLLAAGGLDDVRTFVDGFLAEQRRLPRLKEVAAHFQLSPRTLLRRLRNNGTSYRDLCDAQQRRRAVELTMGGKLSVQQLSDQLGFSDSSTCRRAVRRWFGLTPVQLLRQRRTVAAA